MRTAWRPKDAVQVRYILDHINHDALVGSESGIGPWQDFVAQAGWNSLLRFRLTPSGVQLEGAMQPTFGLSANTDTLMGVLPSGYQPQRRQWLAATVVFPVPTPRYLFASVWADAGNGQLLTWWPEGSGGGSYVAVCGFLTLEP